VPVHVKVTLDPVAGAVEQPMAPVANIVSTLSMNRLVAAPDTPLMVFPDAYAPAIKFPDVFDATVMAGVESALTVTGVPNPVTPENDSDPPMMFAGVPPVTVTTIVFAPVATPVIRHPWTNPWSEAVVVVTRPSDVIDVPAHVAAAVHPAVLVASTLAKTVTAPEVTPAPTVCVHDRVVDPALEVPADDG